MISDVGDALQTRTRRRRWSNDVKAQIVAESRARWEPSSRRSRVGTPQLLSAWRKAARQGLLKLADGTRADGEQARWNGRDPGSAFVRLLPRSAA